MLPVPALLPSSRMGPRPRPRSSPQALSWRGLAILSVVLATAAPVQAQPARGDCNGLDFDVTKAVIVAKVVSSAPKVSYVKGASENPYCPANGDRCRSDASLAPGDLVLTNGLRSPFACVTHQSPQDTQQVWTNGWFPSASLAAVAPLRTPRTEDWIGTWSHPGGEVRIEPAEKGKLAILGFQAYPGSRNEHTGAMQAQVMPAGATIAFAGDGTKPFGKNDDECQARMQRIDDFLIVEDNGSCGSVAVTFTGFYRRKP